MTPRVDVQGMIKELTQPVVHREPITQPRQNSDGTYTLHTTGHVSKHPSLLHQLEQCAPTMQRLEGTSGTFTSKPSANVEAVDCHMRIDREASKWVRQLGHDDPPNTTAVVLKLGGLYPQLDKCGSYAPAKHATCCPAHAVERDIRSWWVQARIVSGWDEAPWSPANTCPLCGARGTLRIRLVEQIGSCTGCHETWSPDEIGLLADHMRLENGETEEDEPA